MPMHLKNQRIFFLILSCVIYISGCLRGHAQGSGAFPCQVLWRHFPPAPSLPDVPSHARGPDPFLQVISLSTTHECRLLLSPCCRRKHSLHSIFFSFPTEERAPSLLCNFFQPSYVATPIFDMFRWNSIVIPILRFVGINVGHIIFITPNTDIDF